MTIFRRSLLLLMLPALLISCGSERSGEMRATSDRTVRTSTDGAAEDAGSPSAEMLAPGASESVSDETRIASDEIQQPAPRAGQLTAGEWNDLREWEFWKSLDNRDDIVAETGNTESLWGFRTSGRVPVAVTSSSGNPVVDAQVDLVGSDGKVVWSARTDNRGRAELFTPPSAPRQSRGRQFSIQVDARGRRGTPASVTPGSSQHHVVTLQDPPQPARGVDVMFVVDATGSMGDEINYLKTELRDVMARSASLVGEQQTYRLASTFYRDHGDEYVVRSFPFTTSVDQVLEQMKEQEADGGGDIEEAVEEGLADALEKHDWSQSARARLLFLVLDAPPHATPEISTRIAKLTELAASKGVRVIPVASSGVDKSTEFFLRNMAISTGGTYVFLTNHSGIGNSHIEPTIGEYKVEYLNDLLVRLIVEYSETTRTTGGVAPTMR